MVTCIMRAQESEPEEKGLRKVPDIYKDDLAQRRIQGSLASHREAPCFVKVCNITAADLETWERLKVSGKTRCVMFSIDFFPLPMVLFNFERIKCFSFEHPLFSWLGKQNASQNTEYILHELKLINTKSYKPHEWKTYSIIQPP